MDHATNDNDVLSAIGRLEERVCDRLDAVDERFAVMDDRFAFLTERVATVGGNVSALRRSCVTKEHLDELVSDMRHSLVTLVRKTDHRLEALIDVLRGRDLINDEDRTHLAGLGPFSRT